MELTKENFLPSCQAAMERSSVNSDEVIDIARIIKDAGKVHRIVFPYLYFPYLYKEVKK